MQLNRHCVSQRGMLQQVNVYPVFGFNFSREFICISSVRPGGHMALYKAFPSGTKWKWQRCGHFYNLLENLEKFVDITALKIKILENVLAKKVVQKRPSLMSKREGGGSQKSTGATISGNIIAWVSRSAVRTKVTITLFLTENIAEFWLVVYSSKKFNSLSIFKIKKCFHNGR